MPRIYLKGAGSNWLIVYHFVGFATQNLRIICHLDETLHIAPSHRAYCSPINRGGFRSVKVCYAPRQLTLKAEFNLQISIPQPSQNLAANIDSLLRRGCCIEKHPLHCYTREVDSVWLFDSANIAKIGYFYQLRTDQISCATKPVS